MIDYEGRKAMLQDRLQYILNVIPQLQAEGSAIQGKLELLNELQMGEAIDEELEAEKAEEAEEENTDAY